LRGISSISKCDAWEDMLDSVRDGEDFGGVRKESEFYSNELCGHLKVQDVARRKTRKRLLVYRQVSVNFPYAVIRWA
jgi:hypothetical protein